MLTLPMLVLLTLNADRPPPTAAREDPGAPKVMVLKVGEQQRSPIKTAKRCTCDNKRIVGGFIIDGRIEMKGYEPGTTRCTLLAPNLPPQIVTVTVAN